jgi:hypothetical protein
MMKTKMQNLFLALALLGWVQAAQAQFTYMTNSGAITITGDTNIPVNGVVVIPNTINDLTVTSIGDEAFIGSTLTSVTIPDSVTSIGQYAFDYCPSLTNVSIGDGVSSIGIYAFSDCANLTAIVVDLNNLSYSSVSGVLFDKHQTTLIAFPGGIGSYTVPPGVSSIGDYAFAVCPSLTSITISNSVTNIGDYAFYDCPSLTSITISNGVTNIGDYAFDDCTVLISVTIPASVTSIGDDVFNNCESLTSVTIPASVTSIGQDAFEMCIGLTSVTIPDSVTNIGEEAFEDCQSLTNVSIGNGVITIGNNAFVECFSLTSVTIPDSVTNIGVSAFELCYDLTNVTIGNGVISIGNAAFDGCVSLPSVSIGSGVTNIGIYAFFDCPALTSVFFQGNAPTPTNDYSVFQDDSAATAYYLPVATGWGPIFDGIPTMQLSAPPQIGGGNLGGSANGFGFTITGSSNQVVVIDASTNLVNWQPIQTNTLSGTSFNFTDSKWRNYRNRFYRVKGQ